MLLESYHIMMDEMSQDQAPNLKLEIYKNLQKPLPFHTFWSVLRKVQAKTQFSTDLDGSFSGFHISDSKPTQNQLQTENTTTIRLSK